MHKYQVGKLYTDRRQWPELAQYNYRGGEHELVLFLKSPTSAEIQAISRAQANFALYVERSLIILLYKFGREIDWSDAPYSIHLVPREERKLASETTENEQALLHIVLVDAGTGIIRAMRVISMPTEFTQALHRAINQQAAMPFTRSSYNGELESLFAGYSSDTLAQMAPIHFSSRP